jgi:hypothetical protein
MKIKAKVPQSQGTYLGFDHHLIPLDEDQSQGTSKSRYLKVKVPQSKGAYLGFDHHLIP